MEKARLTIATSFALVLLWAGAAEAAPAVTQPAGLSTSFVAGTGISVEVPGTAAKTGGLTAAQRKARARALKKCKRIRRKARRKSCVKRVKKKYRRIARGNAIQKPVKPAPATRVHEVTVFDHVFVPSAIEIKQGEAIRFTWDEDNKDAHGLTPFVYPDGVNPFDFDSGSAPSRRFAWQRTFTIPGDYRIGCSQHHLQTIDVKVTR